MHTFAHNPSPVQPALVRGNPPPSSFPSQRAVCGRQISDPSKMSKKQRQDAKLDRENAARTEKAARDAKDKVGGWEAQGDLLSWILDLGRDPPRRRLGGGKGGVST